MAEEVRNNLFLLQNCCKIANTNAAVEAERLIRSTKKYFEGDVNKSELDLAFSALFDQNNGILKTLEQNLKLKVFKAANAESFSLLTYLFHNYISRLPQYVSKIKHICMTCLALDQDSVVKERAVNLLIAIVGAERGSPDLIPELQLHEVVDKLLSQVSSTQKSSVVVRQKQYHLLGLIARKYPQDAVGKSEKILKQFLYELKQQTQFANKVEFSLITGCITGLTEFLHSFAQDPDDDEFKYAADIYAAVKLLAEINNIQHRKVANRAALSLVAQHGRQLSRFLHQDYKWWHKQLQQWILMPVEEKKVGYKALETFYEQMALALQEDSEAREAFLYFIDFFKQRLMSGDTSAHDLRVTIKAFGQFAGPCQVHMQRQDVESMCSLLVQRIEQLYIQDDDHNSANLAHYMQSLATILSQLHDVTPDQLAALERITVSLIRSFPRQVTPVQMQSKSALLATLHHVSQCKGVYLQHFVHNIVYQGIAQTCSHRTAIDIELLKEENPNNYLPSYKSYLPLWMALLDSEQYDQNLKVSLALKQCLVTKIYDEFITVVLILIKKLDLNTRKKVAEGELPGDPGLPMLDPETGLEATNYIDQQVFVNLVDLCSDLLPNVKLGYMFEKWVHRFGEEVAFESYRKPLVSGFYKLLAIAFQIAEQIGYFGDVDNVERQTTSKLLSRFLQEVMTRQMQYKDDLQIACLKTVLLAPVQLIVPLVPFMGPTFQVVFRLGSSYLPLAHMGLHLLERCHAMMPVEQLRPLLAQILHCFDPFLQSSAYRGDPALSLSEDVLRLKRRKSRESENVNESQLSLLQGRIVSFLGGLDSSTVSALVNHNQVVESRSPGKQHLIYSLPFADIKPDVHLDEFIPRIIELALKSSDRRTRVTACELLHAIVMYILGNGTQLEASSPQLLSWLFEQLCGPLIRLACDADSVVHQLFHPLLLQLVHWYSSKYQLRSLQAVKLLEALLDGIMHENDTAVRDLSAKCLREFVTWSIRQLTEEELDTSEVNVKAIVKKIYSYCLHPSSTKRLGAALAFNSIYAVLRTQDVIIDRFWLELLYYMVTNLATEGGSSGHKEQVSVAVQHIEKVLHVKAVLFNKENPKRSVPPDFRGPLLHDAVMWLTQYCSAPQPECRHKCMELVFSLAPYVTGVASARQFIASLPASDLMTMCEGGSNVKSIANMTAPTANHSFEYRLQWFSCLLASLECYVWLIGEALVKPEELFGAAGERPAIFKAIDSLQLAIDYNVSMDGREMSPWELEKYTLVRCSTLIRTFDFIVTLLYNSKAHSVFTRFSSTFPALLFEAISLCIFHPDRMGFDRHNVEIALNLPQKMEKTLTSLKQALLGTKLEDQFVNSFTDKVDATIIRQMLDRMVNSLRTDEVTLEQEQFVGGLKIMSKCELVDSSTTGLLSLSTVFTAVASCRGATSYAVQLQPNALAHAHNLLDLCFLMGHDHVTAVLEYVMHPANLINPDTQSCVTHGEHFTTTVRAPVMSHLLNYPRLTVDRLFETTDLAKVVALLADILQHLTDNVKIFPSATAELESGIMLHWAALQSWASDSNVRLEHLLGLLCRLAGTMPSCVGWLSDRHPAVADWVLDQLHDQHHDLTLKTRALELLPCVGRPEEDDNKRLESALKSVKNAHFPQSSCELQAESRELSSFVSAFQNILLGLEVSGSRVVLRSLIGMVAADNNHVCEESIQLALAAFMARLSIDNQVKALQLGYDIFSSNAYDPLPRHGCVHRFLIPMLRRSDVVTVQRFYTANIKSLMALLDAPLDKPGSLEAEQQLVGREGGWSLVEIMFAMLDIGYLEDLSCPITHAAFPGAVKQGREVVLHFSNRAFNLRTEVLSREVHCAAYAALVAIISNTKREAKFYSGLLFLENKAKGQLIWERLIDVNKTYEFPLDCDSIPKTRKKLVSIRREVSNQQDVMYLPTSTQQMFNSSLNEDMTRFDFSNCIVRSQSYVSVAARDSRSQNMVVSLDSDDLNEHECMATLCALIRHMVDTGVTPVQDDGVPGWMENLKNSYLDRTKPKNVRLFIVKLIINTERYFQPYSKYWTAPLLDSISDRTLGDDINYLVSDVITMAASWGPVVIDRRCGQAILAMLMSKCNSFRRDMLKHNLELIKTFIAVWKEWLEVPYQLLLDQISPQLSREELKCGIQLVAVVLANGISPWNALSKDDFLRNLVSALNHVEKVGDVFQPCSEVIGMTLKLMDLGEGTFTNEDSEFLQSIHKKLEYLSSNTNKQGRGNTESSLFLTCLSGIHRHFSHIVDNYLKFLLFSMPKRGTARSMVLEMLCSRLEQLDKTTVYAELCSKGLYQWLSSEDVRHQELALQMVNKMADMLDAQQLRTVMTEVCKFATSERVSSRELMYKMLVWVHKERSAAVGWDEDKSVCKATLLGGMVDTEPTLQETVYKHWSCDSGLPLGTDVRLIALLQNLYSNQTEPFFLGCAAELLLELAVTTPDYNRPLFRNPLTQCDFQEYRVLVSWRAQHTSIAPMFAQTLASQLGSVQSLATPALRATQASLATHHLAQAGGTRSSLQPSSFSSSLLFTSDSSSIVQPSYRNTQPSFRSSGHGEQVEPVEDESPAMKSRRFLKNRSKIGFYHAGRELRRQMKEDERSTEVARQREANIKMVRTYRTGDFPDIEITNKEILMPLQALAKRDTILARQLFVSLFTGVTAQLSSEESRRFGQQASIGISAVLQSSTDFTPALIAALMEVALQNNIWLDTDQVALVSLNSGLTSLGCLFIENRLINSEDLEPIAKRPLGIREAENKWLKLAELYCTVGEWDIVRSIFQHQLTNLLVDGTKALDAEAAGRWDNAMDDYKKALEKPSREQTQANYIQQGYFKSLAHLSEWSKLNENIKQKVNEDVEELWTNQWNREQLLPWLFTSTLHCSKPPFTSLSSLVDNVSTWLQDPEKAVYLKKELSEEVSVLYALKPDYESARHYADTKMCSLLNTWTQLDPLARQLRTDTLLAAQTLTEIQSYLSFAGSIDEHKYEMEAKKLANAWKNNLPTNNDSILLWDTRIAYRCHFLGQMKARLPECKPLLEETQSYMQLALVNVALQQRNFRLARKFIEKKENKACLNSVLKNQWILAKSANRWLRADMDVDKQEKITWLLKSWTNLETLLASSESDKSTEIAAFQQRCTIAISLIQVIETEEEVDQESISKLHHLFPNVSSKDVFISRLQELELSSLKMAIQLAESLPLLDQRESTIAATYLRLAQHCSDYLPPMEIATYILRAMKHGSEDARQLFPQLLQMETLGTDAEFTRTFIEECSSVPEWMFLGWVSQILAMLDGPIMPALEALIMRLAKAYPNAIKFQFRLSRENYTFSDVNTAVAASKLVNRLSTTLLADPLLDKMIQAFSSLAQFDIILKYHRDVLIDHLENSRDVEIIKKAYLVMMDELFPSDELCKRGRISQPLLRKKSDLEKLFTNQLVKNSYAKCLEVLKNMEVPSEKQGGHLMKDYSPWLDQFQAAHWDSSIEIPGQYDGESKPIPQHHITITGFVKNVSPQNSLRRPVRITVLGNDAREYSYLVKFGEDLRQDQRVQQLIRLMNKILARDANCSQRGLGVETYQVIPLSNRLGMIQWIDNTVPLGTFITDALTGDEKDIYDTIPQVFIKWIQAACRASKDTLSCMKAAIEKYSRDQTIAAYRERVNLVPWDILRRAVLNLSGSSERYFLLRHELATSHATVSLAHWLLGIGDRHLSNSLVIANRGKMLGIDFGYAFGTATHLLPLPELIPFRLTPHIINLIQPMHEGLGLYRETMLHCLRALRQESASTLLLATMEVFVQEPSIDWQRNASKIRFADSPGENEAQDDGEEGWFERTKIASAKQKLQGQNPAAATCDDLRLGKYKGTFLQKCTELARGDPQHNVRARLQSNGLSPEEQIECLLDQATDYHILGKTYYGWSPWI